MKNQGALQKILHMYNIADYFASSCVSDLNKRGDKYIEIDSHSFIF